MDIPLLPESPNEENYLVPNLSDYPKFVFRFLSDPEHSLADFHQFKGYNMAKPFSYVLDVL